MSLLRIDDAGLAASVATVQRRAFCHFDSTAQRNEQLPDPELGTVSVIGISYEFWDGSAWEPLIGDSTVLDARVSDLEDHVASLLDRMTAAEGRLTTLEARPTPAPIAAGVVDVSTDGSGRATFTHGLGVAPRTIIVSLHNQVSPNGGTAVNDWALVESYTTTTATVRLGDSHGDQYVNRSGVRVYYAAIG